MTDGNKLLLIECLQLTSIVVTHVARNTQEMTKSHEFIFRSPLSIRRQRVCTKRVLLSLQFFYNSVRLILRHIGTAFPFI